MKKDFNSLDHYLWKRSKSLNSVLDTKESMLSILEMQEVVKNLLNETINYLQRKGWIFDSTTKNFYKKENNFSRDFRTLSIPRNKLSPQKLGMIYAAMAKKHSIEKSPLEVIDQRVPTDFVISWIQDSLLWSMRDDNSYFLLQPVIRLNWDWKGAFFVDGKEWIWTSFVNPTEYQTQSNNGWFFEGVEHFLDFMNKVGLYVWNVSLQLKIKEDCRGKKKVLVFTIHFYYWNLHIWDTSLVFDGVKREPLRDLWFWLERINLARNKYDNYFQQYCNPEILTRYSNQEVDSIKTLSLLLMLDFPELLQLKWPKATYRKLLKTLNKTTNYFPLIQIFEQYWQFFYDRSKRVNLERLLEDLEKY